MPKDKNAFVEFRAIRSRITMEQVLEHYRVLGKFKRTGNRLSGPCPIHNGSNPSQFRVDTEKNIWNCFSECKHGGNVLDFIARKEGIPIHAAALKACEWFGISLTDVKNDDNAPAQTAERPSKPSMQPAASKPAAPTEPEDDTPNPPLRFRLENLRHEHPYL